MRVAIFSDALAPRVDGIAVAVQHLAAGLVRAGHRVLLIGPGEKVVPGTDFLRLPAIPTPFDGYRLAVPLRSRMHRALRRFRPDVVSAQTVGPIGLIGLSLARGHHVPALFSWHTDFETYGRSYRISPRLLAAGSYSPLILNRCHGPGPLPTREPSSSRGLIPASLRRASLWMSAVCVPSSGTVDQVRRIGVRRPVYVLPADVPTSELGVGGRPGDLINPAERGTPGERVPSYPGPPYLLFVGRLSREKNLELLLDAFVQGVPAPVRLVLVGPVNDSRMRSVLAETMMAVPGRIVLLGSLPRAELGEIYRCASIFVTPSLSETQCLGVCEAVALGVRVLVVDPRLAQDRPAGTVRVTRPEPAALARVLRELLREPPPTSVPEVGESLANRFVAAAESVSGRDEGTTLHWVRGGWAGS